jgi:hypothetical protein
MKAVPFLRAQNKGTGTGEMRVARSRCAAILNESTKYCDSYCAKHWGIMADHLSKARWSSAGSPLRIRDMP